MTSANTRTADFPIDPLFLERWSPRAFTDEEIPEATLMTMFEAARWAPSSFNFQPWRFIWARRGTPAFATILSVLIPFNQSWAGKAAALFVAVSQETSRAPGADKDTPLHSHSFDSGAAWAQFALQATRMGWQAHGMTGVDFTAARTALNVPEGFRVEMAAAIGRQGDKSLLPEQMAAREAPSPRLPLAERVFEGTFPAA